MNPELEHLIWKVATFTERLQPHIECTLMESSTNFIVLGCNSVRGRDTLHRMLAECGLFCFDLKGNGRAVSRLLVQET